MQLRRAFPSDPADRAHTHNLASPPDHMKEALEAAPADEGDDIITVTDSSDPYAPAYADAAESGGVPLPGVPGGEVPIWAVVTGVVLVLLACAGIGTFLWFRRTRRDPPMHWALGPSDDRQSWSMI